MQRDEYSQCNQRTVLNLLSFLVKLTSMEGPYQKMRVQKTSSSLGVHMDPVSFYHGYCKSSPHQNLDEGGTCGSLKGVEPPSGTWHFDLPEHMKNDLTVEHVVDVERMVCYGT